MPRNMEIDYVRQVIIQTIQQEYLKNPSLYIGRKDQVELTSYYEHLASDDEVDRFVETVRELNNQQNRASLIINGVIVAPSNPTITNLSQVDIEPMDFAINFRCTLEDIAIAKDTIDNVVKLLKGRKQDIAEFDTGELFMVGTLGNNVNGKPLIKNGDFIGTLPNTTPATSVNTFITNRQTELINNFGFESEVLITIGSYLYYEEQSSGKLCVAVLTDDGWVKTTETTEYPNIIFPPEHNSFTRFKLSVSFDGFRLGEPREINSVDYIDLSFGGSATLTSENVSLGNELTKLAIKRYKTIKSDDGTLDTIFNDEYTWLEPLELPSGNGADTMLNQLTNNNFVNKSHTNSISITNQYTFILNKQINLIRQLFLYARYGIQTYITPNVIYKVVELWSSWGEIEEIEFDSKIIENIDIANNESDVLTISLPMQIQSGGSNL